MTRPRPNAMPGHNAFQPARLYARLRARTACGSRTFGFVLGLGLALSAGCEDNGPDFDNTRINEIQADAAAEPPPLDPAPKSLITVRRVDLPLGADTEAAWRQIDPSLLPGLTAGVWRVNGIRIGVLRPEDRVAFTNAMPEVFSVSELRVATGSVPAPLIPSARLTSEVLIDLTVPPARVETQAVRGGNLQLLVRSARGPDDPAAGRVIEVIPHHHRRRETVVPRSPLESALDGTVFDALTLRAQLPPDTLLVIGLDRSALGLDVEEPEVEDTDAGGPGEIEAEVAVDGETVPAEPAEEPQPQFDRPAHLGEAILTDVRLRQRTQVMLFLSARPLRLGIDPAPREPDRASVRAPE
ncbi:MAG: hypothetical protein AAF288_01885 [Planctomycetota bacterium]